MGLCSVRRIGDGLKAHYMSQGVHFHQEAKPCCTARLLKGARPDVISKLQPRDANR